MKAEEKRRASVAKKSEASDAGEKSEKKSEEELAESMENIAMENMSTIIEVLWNISVVDIESTLRKVCIKVLKDGSASPDARAARAKGLLALGELLLERSVKSQKGLDAFADKLKSEIGAAKKAAKIRQEQADKAKEGGSSSSSSGIPTAAVPTIDDLRTLSVPQLRALLDQLGVDYSDCVEKEDMVKNRSNAAVIGAFI